MSSPYWGKHAGKSGKIHLPGIVFVVLFVVEVFLSHSWTSTLGPFKFFFKKPLFQIQLISWIIENFFLVKNLCIFCTSQGIQTWPKALTRSMLAGNVVIKRLLMLFVCHYTSSIAKKIWGCVSVGF
jgi:hypothetical protein